MTKDQIYKKLDLLKTDEGKLNYLKQISKKTDLMSPETKKSFYSILGDYEVKKGRRWDAIKAYERAGDKKRFMLIGDREIDATSELNNHFSYGNLDLAKEVYNQVDPSGKLFKNKFMKLRDYLIKKALTPELSGQYKDLHKYLLTFLDANLDKIKKTYELLGLNETSLKNKFIKLGDDIAKELLITPSSYFGGASLEILEQAYKKVNLNKSLLKNKIKNFGDAALKKGRLELAGVAYEKINDKKDLLKVGDILLENGDLYDSKVVYKKLNNKKGLIKVGDQLLETIPKRDRDKGIYGKTRLVFGHYGIENVDCTTENIIDAYEKARVDKNGSKKRMEILAKVYEYKGDKEKAIALRRKVKKLKIKKKFDTIEVYEKAGDKKALSKVGDACVKEGLLEDAMNTYEKARDKKGFSKVGDAWMKNNLPSLAIKAYEKAGFTTGTKKQMEILADLYEKEEKGKKAMALRKKIKKLK